MLTEEPGMTDDTRPTFAEVHARRGYTVGVFFPPEAPWEAVEAVMDRIFEVAGDAQGPEGGGWDAFAVGLAGDQLGIDADLPDGTHIYMSTSCLHGDHEHCKAMVGVNGDKRPGRCKFCDAVCRCPVCKHDVPGHEDHAQRSSVAARTAAAATAAARIVLSRVGAGVTRGVAAFQSSI